MDKANEVMKIVEWYLKGQGAYFIFRTAERTFPIAVCTFPTAECTYRSGEHKQETLSLLILDEFL